MKTILIVLGVLIVAIVLYSVFFNKPSSSNEGGLISGTTSQPVAGVGSVAGSGVSVGQEFISLLLSLQQINLDTTLFQDPVFQSLVDKTVEFSDPGGQGRPNPFAPIGSDFVSNPDPEPEPEIIDFGEEDLDA